MKKLFVLSFLLCIGLVKSYSDDLVWKVVNTTAQNNASGVAAALTADEITMVENLRVVGSINSYDIILFNNKMTNLKNLDLENAPIVECTYEYRSGFHTENDIIGQQMFASQNKYRSIVLPIGSKEIGNSAFQDCKGLTSVTMKEGLKIIGLYAFSHCSNLSNVVFPTGLEEIKGQAFEECISLTKIVLPDGLKKITSYLPQSPIYGAFYYCIKLEDVILPPTLLSLEAGAFSRCAIKEINLPPSLVSIGRYVFHECTNLESVRIPSSVRIIQGDAFSGCNAIKDIFTYTIEPTNINQNTFSESTYENAIIHVPSTSFNVYYWNTEWSQFQKDFVAFDDPYEYFYINNDYTLDDNTGRIDGEPDADLNPGSGLVVEGDEDQDLDNVHMKEDDDSGSSIIGEGNIDANNLFIDITIKKNQWYFFCFPYRIKLADIVCKGSYTFRLYDGEERANNGYGGWKHLPEAQEYLEPNQGYIFRCNQNTTLQIPVEKTQYGKFSGEDEQVALNHYPSSNPEDASWNFTGQPYPCYYDIDKTNFDGPITVWNGTAYETVRPGDDEYQLRPFEGYFVQKPVGQNEIDFDSDGRHTYQQWDGIVAQKQQAPRRSPAVTGRWLVNLILTDGVTTDKTRIVFNERCTADYEIGTDAAKFMADNVPQLYSIDAKQVYYAINECPEGEVRLGYVATKAGTMTISGKRMDADVMLRDNLTGETFDLSNGSYSFTTEAGTFDQRFTLLLAGGATGIKTVKTDDENSPVYTVDGKRVAETKANQLYIKEGKKLINK